MLRIKARRRAAGEVERRQQISLPGCAWLDVAGGDPSCDPGLGMERISCAGKKCRAVPCSDQPGDNRAVLILYLLWLTLFWHYKEMNTIDYDIKMKQDCLFILMNEAFSLKSRVLDPPKIPLNIITRYSVSYSVLMWL